jgi:hypothetical protein
VVGQQPRRLGQQHPADEPDRRGDQQPVAEVPQHRAGVLRRAGQQQRAGQQAQHAGRHRDGNRRAERLPVRVSGRVVHEQGAEQAGQGRRGGQRAARGEEEMCPAGGTCVLSSRITEQRNGRDRNEKARQPGQLHAGR